VALRIQVGVQLALLLGGENVRIAVTDIRLTADQMRALDGASAPAPGFTIALAQPFVRRMVFGGNDVAGWRKPRR
jgi:hypothetical protein